MQALTFLSDGVIATRDTAVALPRQVWRETAFRTLSHGQMVDRATATTATTPTVDRI